MGYDARKRLEGYLNIIGDQILKSVGKVWAEAFHFPINDILHLYSTLYSQSALQSLLDSHSSM